MNYGKSLGHKRINSNIMGQVNYSNMSVTKAANSNIQISQLSQLSKPKSASLKKPLNDKPKQILQVFKPIIEKGGKMNIKSNFSHNPFLKEKPNTANISQI